MTRLTALSGIEFDPLDLDPDSVDLLDLAHSLAGSVRYRGHSSPRIWVAYHCVLVSHLVRQMGGSLADQLAALLHDGNEAYLPDVPAPMIEDVPELASAERRAQSAIYNAFGVEADDPALVYSADLAVRADEAMAACPKPWQTYVREGTKPGRLTILGLTPEAAEWAFLAEWIHLSDHQGVRYHAALERLNDLRLAVWRHLDIGGRATAVLLAETEDRHERRGPRGLGGTLHTDKAGLVGFWRA